MVAGARGWRAVEGCRPAHAFCMGPPAAVSSDDNSVSSPHWPPPSGGGVQAFVDGIISPFMACWQPPISSCVSPTTSYMGACVTPRSQEHSTQPNTHIKKPHPNDVLCGRGGATNSHAGNLNFRSLVGANKDMYVTLTKKQKMMMARAIVGAIKNQDPPGRFLQKDPETSTWFDIGLPRSLEKTSQALREKTAADRVASSEDAVQDDRDGSEAGSRTLEIKSISSMSTPTNSAPSSPVTTPTTGRSNSTTATPEIVIPDHLEAQFNPQYARRRVSYKDYPWHPHSSSPPQHPYPSSPPHYPSSPPHYPSSPPHFPSSPPHFPSSPQGPYLPRFSHPPKPERDPRAAPPRHGHYPPVPPPHMYHHGPSPYVGHDYREYHMSHPRSQGPPPPRLPPPPMPPTGPPPRPYPAHSMASAVLLSPPAVVPSDFPASPPRREGANISPGRAQEWKRRRTSQAGSASRVPDSPSSLSEDMQSRLSLENNHGCEMTSPSAILQSRSRRSLSASEEEAASGLAALSSAALLMLDEEKK